MSKFLVTGGAGFIGSHIMDSLVGQGHEVVVLDNFSTGKSENLLVAPPQLVDGDVRDAETCLKAAEGCDGIFHEAALVSVPDSVNRPRDNHDINITGTLNVLEAARQKGVRRVVFASSAAVYGDNPELPKREDMLPEPKSPYAMAKLAGEHYLKLYAECYGLETVALRYFNVFGPRQDPSSMYSGVISIFSERIKKGLPITIYGDGSQTRDFVNVKDIVQANLLAMESPVVGSKTLKVECTSHIPHPTFHILNTATGTSHSLLDLISILGELCGVEPKVTFAPSRSGDIRHSLADISKAWKILGYEPTVELNNGLEDLLHSSER